MKQAELHSDSVENNLMLTFVVKMYQPISAVLSEIFETVSK